MNILITYATKSGAAKECSLLLQKGLFGSTLIDLNHEIPSLDDYDVIIIGSGVRMGKLYKPVRNFIRKNQSVLLKKKTIYFLCNAYPDTLQKTIKTSFVPELIDSAICIESFGGYAPFSPPKENPLMGLNVEKINEVATQIKE
ncbi:menaquinone-dependent protoporphyrinogen oxidase [Anaerovirgula multivorans]|uniref:Menaquinone-dependent protoporphyrinogen oxidase n=1 Tax=Anaerovirgula multivorans TaxID=312168 RepID=A0A239HUG7_9FIRM|nr:flavodoxin domain-containing protein [Anaerovirgula multivorans]SNS84976.1 menaquinone-dependent protoporphyrinogen oxidase [Anaerovirgula multivorans]